MQAIRNKIKDEFIWAEQEKKSHTLKAESDPKGCDLKKSEIKTKFNYLPAFFKHLFPHTHFYIWG